MKLQLPFLETMATQACNLVCTGCTNYSDIKHSGYVRWHDMHSQLSAWLKVLDIPDFGIMGGEPLINPEIKQWITGVRELMPDAQIRFTTNGLLLHKHMAVVDLMHDIGNCVFKITAHVDDTELENTIADIFNRYNWEPVTEYGIDRWAADNGVRFQINRPTKFIKTYRNSYSNMQPHDSNPVDSFNMCIQQTCPLLHNGKIYKCSTQGLLEPTLAKFNNPNAEQWAPYLVNGLSPSDPVSVIEQFVNNFGKPNAICRMCPSSVDSVVPHTVQFR